MNLIRFPKCYKFVIGILIIISQVANSIEDDICNDSITLVNSTNYDHELHILGRYRRQNTNTDQRCKIPNYPLNSIYEIITEPEAMYKPGDHVKTYSTLRISCEKGYKQPPFSLQTSICLDGQWENLPPACVRTCRSLKSTKSMIVKCKYNDSISLDNCIHPVEGTTVRLSCNTYYEADAAIKRNPIRACKNGEWYPNLPECYATCGLKSPKATFNIINGENVAPGDYPWHIGIYTNTEEFRCGGSIIHQNIIISAAHCFADFSGNKYPAKDYLVAAGKYYNQYHDDRDRYAQYSSVRDIFIPEQYKSINGFNSFDIAIAILEDPFTYNLGVQPVCIELNDEYENNLMNSNGIVTGWGYTDERQVLSNELKELIIPYIPYDECYNKVPPNFRRFLTADKFCGGFVNQSTSVCQGDSGGGLVYNINNHYFIQGIVSTSPATTESDVTQCDSQQYGLYTSIKYHSNFITKLTANYVWKEDIQCVRDDCTNEDIENRESCRLPNFPQHGKYSLPNNNTKYKSGNYVLIHTVILLSCDPGYVANPPGRTVFYCLGNGKWIPAVGVCEAIEAKSEIKHGFYIKWSFRGAIGAVDGTHIEIITTPATDEHHEPYCTSNEPVPPAKKDYNFDSCGKSMASNKFIDNGNDVMEGAHPWAGAMFLRKTPTNVVYLCGATLITERLALTTGLCVSNYTSSDITIVFGTTDISDWLNNSSQSTKIEKVELHPDYDEDTSDGDIAILLFARELTFTPRVSPACLWEIDSNLESIVNKTGVVVGLERDENAGAVHNFRKLYISVVSQEACLGSAKAFVDITSNRTFCAGKNNNSNYSGPCNGDTGSGLCFNRNGKWIIRGIVARFLVDFNQKCNPNYYGVFTDVAKYIQWIHTFL